MAWAIDFLPAAEKELEKLDRTVSKPIVTTLKARIAVHPDPRSIGVALKGPESGFWCWRIGDYRVIGQVEDARITILVIRVAHRREVYR